MGTIEDKNGMNLTEEEEKKKGYKKIFEDIILDNFRTMDKEMVNQVQEW